VPYGWHQGCDGVDLSAARKRAVSPPVTKRYSKGQVKVDLKTHRTEDGRDYTMINPKGYVPALVLDNGDTLTENVAILSWIADQAKPASPGPLVRYRLPGALAYIPGIMVGHAI
jgi:hypothetical protein